MSFNNRTAVVTGAGGNIGHAICRQLGALGVHVAATDVSLDTVTKTANELQALGYDIRPYQQDVTSSESIQSSFAQIISDFGKVDILINNAGVWCHHDGGCRHFLETISDDDWKRIIDINLLGTFHCMKQVIPGMAEHHFGRIINLGSIAGNSGLPGAADYSAAKAAVIMLTKVAAMENAKRGITVNSVSPGMVARGDARPNNGTWLGRSGTTDEIARAIVFLADDDAGYITGVDVPVDGGRILGPHNFDINTDNKFLS
ncbi:MAG: SDR family oxidoreductase [Victivallales bacterium]|nr:SDR family oxidoreductase [Victivallales bacterium]